MNKIEGGNEMNEDEMTNAPRSVTEWQRGWSTPCEIKDHPCHACAIKQKEIDALREANSTFATASIVHPDCRVCKHVLKTTCAHAAQCVNGRLFESTYPMRLWKSEEKPPVEPEEVYSPHTEVLK